MSNVENVETDAVSIPLHGALGEGRHALVSAEDAAAVEGMRWYLHPRGYPQAVRNVPVAERVDGKKATQVTLMQRLLAPAHGLPDGKVSFANGNPLDLRRGNLVPWTAAGAPTRATKRKPRPTEQGQGQSPEYRGVRPVITHRGGCRVPSDRFQATFQVKHLGTYDTAEEAARSYDAAARAHYGDKAITNFP